MWPKNPGSDAEERASIYMTDAPETDLGLPLPAVQGLLLPAVQHDFDLT